MAGLLIEETVSNLMGCHYFQYARWVTGDSEQKCLGIDIALQENEHPLWRMITARKFTYIDEIDDIMIDDEGWNGVLRI